MSFWNRKKRRGTGYERQTLVKGAKRLQLDASLLDGGGRQLRRVWQPRALGRVVGGQMNGMQPSFAYSGGSRGDFYRWMRDNIPIISAGVWAWVRLCATRTKMLCEGGASEQLQAEMLISALDGRILESPYGRGSGLEKLIEAYFLEIFTTGRFAGQAVLADDGRSIDHFRFIDPYRIGWEKDEEGWKPYQTAAGEGRREPSKNRLANGIADEVEWLDPATFFYGTLGTDITNPSGIEPLATIPFVSEIEQLMLEDMARSSHNAGTPRLQVKVGRPEKFNWEGDQEYTDRANNFFESLVGQFQHLEPDDNIFTWDDVEVTVVGGSGKQWEWRLNREQVLEDVVTGLKLFPWVLGRTHKTTQNWVQSQFDLLMQMVAAHQKSGADLVDWLCNLELQLNGVDATIEHSFSSHPDPFRLERAQAGRIEFDLLDAKVEKGYISKEEAIAAMH